jgi:uncharacterized repeat protein (TIGR03809 family)
MTHRIDVPHDPAVVARWCTLAEQRLDYLTELFNSGRWRRYYSHATFLENIKEAKAMVAHWRALSTPGYVPEPRAPILISEPTPDAVEPAAREMDIVVTNQPAATEKAAAAPAPDVLEQMASSDNLVWDRYTLLRNLLAQ